MGMSGMGWGTETAAPLRGRRYAAIATIYVRALEDVERGRRVNCSPAPLVDLLEVDPSSLFDTEPLFVQ